ncbi:MAG TPA: hypothetical protein VMV49_12410, partial [Candidatus Deferrimicrobium sp.]|nr:hypothetical protein [Candidatus Deferrimicrobium sp.]
PITAWGRFLVNFTNLHTSESVFVRIWEVDIPSVPGPMGASKWAFFTGIPGQIELFVDSNVLGLGIYNITIQLNKINHESISRNFTLEVRKIRTMIEVIDPIDIFPWDSDLQGIFRYNYSLRYYYNDNETYRYDWGYNPIGRIPLASFNITDWLEVGGRAEPITLDVSIGKYGFIIQTSANVGSYLVSITANRTNFELASKTVQINVSQASTQIILVKPDFDTFAIWKFGSQEIEIYFRNNFSEPIEMANITYVIKDINEVPVLTGSFVSKGGGHFVATINTKNLKMQGTYTIEINATPADTNYKTAPIKRLTATIKPFWEHPIFIFTMIGVAIAVGALTYREVKWLLLPSEIKAIELAKRNIRKGKHVAVPFREMRNRELMFQTIFLDAWSSIELKPPKLVKMEVIALAGELSGILRIKITTPEAETFKAKLEIMSIDEAQAYLSEMKIPPEASRRILGIVGLIKKEKMEYLEFARALSEIKGTEMDYNQAEDLIKALLGLPPIDADRYLEAMVITKEDRTRLLSIIGIEYPPIPKKEKAHKPFTSD